MVTISCLVIQEFDPVTFYALALIYLSAVPKTMAFGNLF